MNSQKYSAIRKGLLEFAILKIVSADKVYAADILARLKNTEFATQEGTLYPLLSKMCREDVLSYEWQESEAGPPRKYYMLTGNGKKQMVVFGEYWKHLSDQIELLGRQS